MPSDQIIRYGRSVPKHAHGTENLKQYTSSTKNIVEAVLALFDRIVDKNLLIRRVICHKPLIHQIQGQKISHFPNNHARLVERVWTLQHLPGADAAEKHC